MPSGFKTTSWSLVLQAGGPSTATARTALDRLCNDYWFPLYAYARRHGFGSEDARDLIQSFFASLLERDSLKGLSAEKGRFRAYLLACLKHFVSNERERARTLKRGGGTVVVSIEADEAEVRYLAAGPSALSPEQVYERQWAAEVLRVARRRLAGEMRAAGKGPAYDLLSPHLTDLDPRRSYAAIAEELELSDSGVKMAVKRLRRRFGLILRSEVAETLGSDADVDLELRRLLTIISATGGES